MGKNEINYQKPVIDYFKNLVLLHGEDIRSLDWGGRSSQSQRFKVLYDVGINLESSVLDVGCGHGDFYGYLIRKGFCGNYSGVDLTPEMIVIAKNKYIIKNCVVSLFLC